jgi:hypothetical protein
MIARGSWRIGCGRVTVFACCPTTSPNGGKYEAKTGEACQEYVYDEVKAYIDTMFKH